MIIQYNNMTHNVGIFLKKTYKKKVPSRADEEKFKLIITNLLVKSARAVVLFTRADDAR